MIVNISGTGGAGKSHLVRRVMALYDTKVPEMIEDRRRPLGYHLHHTQGKSRRSLFVPGHYETACGGCDTLASFPGTLDFIYALIRGNHDENTDVIYEGMLVNDDVNRCIKLHNDGYPVHVIAIDLPLEDCLASINARRREKNPNAKPVNPKSTTNRWKTIRRRIPKLQAAGVSAEFLPREEAFEKVKVLFEL